MGIRCPADRGTRVTVITRPIMVSIEPLVRAAGPGIHAHGRPTTTEPTTTGPTTERRRQSRPAEGCCPMKFNPNARLDTS